MLIVPPPLFWVPAAPGGGGPAFWGAPVDTSTATIYSFAPVPIDAAPSDCYAFIAITGAGNADRTVVGVTVNGEEATVGGQQAHSSSNSAVVSIWAVPVAPGTTELEIEVEWNGNQFRTGLGVWTDTGVTSLTPVHVVSSQADPATATLTTVAGRLAIIAYYQRSDPGTVVWGAPLDPPDYGELYASSRYHGGRAIVPAGTSLAVSVNPATNDSHVMLAVSYD
jgi:hypothetical protein